MTQQCMCRFRLHPLKTKFASILNGLGPPDCMASTALTPNVSMILTQPAWLTGSRLAATRGSRRNCGETVA
jgi:hypothetical protein